MGLNKIHTINFDDIIHNIESIRKISRAQGSHVKRQKNKLCDKKKSKLF